MTIKVDDARALAQAQEQNETERDPHPLSRVQDPRRLKEKENNAEDAMRQSELDKWDSLPPRGWLAFTSSCLTGNSGRISST